MSVRGRLFLESILGNTFLHVIPIARRLLNCALDKIKNNHTALLNQLLNRHLIFKKLLWIDNASNHISPAEVQLLMNRVHLELEQFMKSAEKDSHRVNSNDIQWSVYVGVWIH